MEPEKSPRAAAAVTVLIVAWYRPRETTPEAFVQDEVGSIEMTLPPASPTAATSNVPAEGAMSNEAVRVPACSMTEVVDPKPTFGSLAG